MKWNKDFVKGLAAGFILSLFAIYSFFRIYWIERIGLKFFRWHAILWLYLSIALLFAGFSFMLYKKGWLKNDTAAKVYAIAFGLFAAWYLAEGILRVTHTGATYMEEREGLFVNPAERMEKNWYMTYRAFIKIELKTPEYNYPRAMNNEGLDDKEWSTEKDSDEIRIITLGDSFTEGDGAPFDSSYPRILQTLLQKDFPSVKINVFNCGRIGSDPWFEYKKLSERLLKYKPDIVVYTNGTNDLLFDHLNYGGMERFLPDSTVKNKIPHHRWLGLYEVSYVFRMMMNATGYDNTLFGIADREKDKATALADSRALSKMYSALASEHHFVSFQVVRPEKTDIEEGHYDFNLADLTRGTDTLPRYFTFDLLGYYQDSLHINGQNVRDYFWQHDGHHNPKGYAAMAQGVEFFIRNEVAERVKF